MKEIKSVKWYKLKNNEKYSIEVTDNNCFITMLSSGSVIYEDNSEEKCIEFLEQYENLL